MAIVTNLECRRLPDFATAYNWRIHMVRPIVGIPTPLQFNTLCKSSTIPKKEANAPTEIVLHRHKLQLPGVEFSSGELTLTFADTVDNRIRDYIRRARNVHHEHNTALAVPYLAGMFDLDIYLQSRQGIDTYKYSLKDCWVYDHDFGTELVDGSDAVIFDGVQIMIKFNDFSEDGILI